MVGQISLLLFLCTCSLGRADWLQNVSTELFRSPGDILLGGLFPINELTSNLSQREEPDDIECNRLNSYGLALSLVMKFSVDYINADQSILPGVRLGFETYDTCGQPAGVMKPTLRFLSEGSTEEVAARCNYTDYATRVVAVIGPYTSEMVSVISKLLGFFLIPQISFSATSDKFSDKKLYPSFMRTVPTDGLQVEAIVELLKEFGWNWVAVVASEDGYGRQGQRQLSELATAEKICVAYEGIIPIYRDPVRTIRNILHRINSTSVGVVVLFALPEPAVKFFIEVIHRNMSMVWIGPTSWALLSDIATLPNIHTVGTILAFADENRPLPQFTDYFQALFSKIQQERPQQPPLEPSSSIPTMGNPCPSCWHLSPDNMSLVEETLRNRQAFSIYAAVRSIAQALHNMLGCNTTSCPPKSGYKIYPWQLLEETKKVSLNISGTPFEFDMNGNPSMGYELLVWTWKEHQMNFTPIGNFFKKLSINEALIQWHTKSNQVPMSSCSADCKTGEVHRIKGFHSCCFDCLPCHEGTFQNNTGDSQCTNCPKGQWSIPRSNHCVDPTYTYLAWDSHESLGLVLAGVVVVICEAVVTVLFLRHWESPVVKATGGPLCALSLLCLMGCCASLVLFLGPPGDVMCRLQLPLNAIFPTVILSTILATSVQLFLVADMMKVQTSQLYYLSSYSSCWFVFDNEFVRTFIMAGMRNYSKIVYVTEFPGKSTSHLQTLRGPGSCLVVLACCGVQAGLCGWFVQVAPSLTTFRSELRVEFVERFLRCPVTPLHSFALMLGFNVLLALISFMCTFTAVKPAGQYNMARDITISTLAYCVVWVIFVPIYTGLDDRKKSISHITVTLVSHLGLVAAYFFPKCYLLMKTPELNTADHFSAYLEGKITSPQEEQAQ